MKIKATFLVFLVSLLSHSAFAGSNCDSLIVDIFNIFKLKYNYEASVMYQQKKATLSHDLLKSSLQMDSLYKIVVEEPAVSLKKYKDKIITIKSTKRAYISCIESELVNKNNASKMVFLYDYKFPMDSYINKESIMNRYDLLKIFKHFIFDSDNNTLPPLKEAVEYLKNS